MKSQPDEKLAESVKEIADAAEAHNYPFSEQFPMLHNKGLDQIKPGSVPDRVGELQEFAKDKKKKEEHLKKKRFGGK